MLDSEEQCDDGNTISEDGCFDCLFESGYYCKSDPNYCFPICGDGFIVGEETCDDKNTEINDGCSSECKIEIGWICSETPSKCKTTCGDGIKTGLEECDDPGNPICFSNCTINQESPEFKAI